MRDRAFEEQALRLIAVGSANPAVERLVAARLAWGDEEYGRARKSWDADGFQEAADEAIDGISWLLLHVQNVECDGDVREYAMRACRAFAEAHRELAVALHLVAA
ncbi:MAG TPA: hypothetical protein VEA41_17380 [Salinarimonas sp.]|nr:hypothetical protein [Salinarimonas sp.]